MERKTKRKMEMRVRRRMNCQRASGKNLLSFQERTIKQEQIKKLTLFAISVSYEMGSCKYHNYSSHCIIKKKKNCNQN